MCCPAPSTDEGRNPTLEAKGVDRVAFQRSGNQTAILCPYSRRIEPSSDKTLTQEVAVFLDGVDLSRLGPRPATGS